MTNPEMLQLAKYVIPALVFFGSVYFFTNRWFEIQAQKNKLKVAYSNDAFELWFLLHYQYFDNQYQLKEYGLQNRL